MLCEMWVSKVYLILLNMEVHHTPVICNVIEVRNKYLWALFYYNKHLHELKFTEKESSIQKDVICFGFYLKRNQ